MSPDPNGPDWEGVARDLLAAELTEQIHKLDDRTAAVVDQLRDGEDITDDDIERLFAGVEQFWYYVEEYLIPVSDVDELPEHWR